MNNNNRDLHAEIETAKEIMIAQSEIDWNAVNYKKEILGLQMSEIPEFKSFSRPKSVKKAGEKNKRNYRSWVEFFLFECSYFTIAQYEPIRCEYVRTQEYLKDEKNWLVKHNPRKAFYHPDTISNANPNVFFEIKGHLTTKDDDRGQKYIDIANQTGKEFVFVLQKEDVILPWTVTNPSVLENGNGDDLKGITMENWCKSNGFLYTYYYNLKSFLVSKEYEELLKRA